MDHTCAMQRQLVVIFFFFIICRCQKLFRERRHVWIEVKWEIKEVEMWGEKPGSKRKATLFSLSWSPLSFFSWAWNICQHSGGESWGPWYVAGLAQESLELLSLARPACLFALTLRLLRGYGTCSSERIHCAVGKKSVTNIYCGGMQSCGLQPARLEL